MTLPAGFLDRPIAHRALHGGGRTENSLSAIRAAVAAGYGIEIDVQPSLDGIAVVFHDNVLDRLTNASGLVRERSARSLSELRLRDAMRLAFAPCLCWRRSALPATAISTG